MSAFTTYCEKAARHIAAECAKLPAPARGQFLFETLERLSPGLYSRVLLQANQMPGDKGVALLQAIARGLFLAIGKQASYLGTEPLSLGYYQELGFGWGDLNPVKYVVKAGEAVVGGVKTGVNAVGSAGKDTGSWIGNAAEKTAGWVRDGFCAVVTNPFGQIGVVAGGAIAGGGAGGAAAGAGTQVMARSCSPAAVLESYAPDFIPGPLKKFFWPAAGVTVLGVLYFALRKPS